MAKRKNSLALVMYLDGESIFKQWVDLGLCSYAKLTQWCFDQKMIHPVTGKGPTRMGVWVSVWLYALHNPADAKKLFDSAMRTRGEFWTEKQWMTLLHSRAKNIYKNGNQYSRYVEEHPAR